MFPDFFPSVAPGASISVNLRNAAIDPPSYAQSLNPIYEAGVAPTSNPGNLVTILHNDAQFVWGDQFDKIWFESIHVDPRLRDLGFILSSQTFTAHVWNAYRWRAKIIDSINISGTAGLVLDNPPPLPIHMPATDMVEYTVLLSADGDPFVENTITWNFDPLEEGTDLIVSGVRLIPFPFEADLKQGPIVESIGFETDIIVSRRKREQRVQLKAIPKYGLEYAILNDREVDSQLCQALLYGWQARAYGVPVWQDSQVLTSAVAAGQSVIPVDTEFFTYQVGGLVFLWKDPQTWEVLTIEEVNPDNIVVNTEVKNTWPVNTTYVMPMQLGRLSEKEQFTWHSVIVSSMQLKWSMESVEVGV